MVSGTQGDPIDVVVLASGVNTIPLYDGYVPGYKALVPFDGKGSLQYVLDALFAVEVIGRIGIEGQREPLEREISGRRASGRIDLMDGGATFLDSVVIGLEHFRHAPAVLFVTADLPLLTPVAVADFLAACARATTTYEHNVFVSAVPRPRYTGAYRRFTKPFNHYRDIQVCHGNLFVADPGLLGNRDIRRQVNRLYSTRKSVLSRFVFGWRVALTYLIGVDLLHTVTLRRMAEVASQQLGVGVVPVLIDHPEITVDVDDADDYRFVRDRIEEQRRERTLPCA
jgi:CTP:molybdopterin cytidylyltransferase MocA